MALAIIYAITVLVIVQANQVIQCIRVLLVRCLDPFSKRMKTYLAGSCMFVSSP